jgi:hypothetical protein
VAAVATVILGGAIANKPRSGGEAWVRLSYVLGLRRLGFEAFVIEQVPRDDPAPAALAYFQEVTSRFGLVGATIVREDGEVVAGLPSRDLVELAESAELLINISGNLTSEQPFSRFRRTAFVDIDPGFTQFWHARGTLPIPSHDVYFTIGENIGTPGCEVPSADIEWRPTRPPVVLDEWPCVDDGDRNRFTSVATWRGPYGRVESNGRVYGLKLDEFRKVIQLPERVPQTFELALDIHPEEQGDLEALRTHGWRLVDPLAVAGDPDSFRRYVQGAAAEFSVAQGIYVETNSGWFSDRTTRYLASGKPALVQDTGFRGTIPTEQGLVAFRTLEEAVAGAEAIAADYDRHARAARVVAEQYFDSDRVIGKLLEDALA